MGAGFVFFVGGVVFCFVLYSFCYYVFLLVFLYCWDDVVVIGVEAFSKCFIFL